MPAGGMMIMAAAAVAGPIIGGVMGNEAARGNREAAQRASSEAYNELLKIGTPPDLSRRIILEQFKKYDTYTPEMEAYISAGASSVGNIIEDPGLRDTQLSALKMIKDRASGGLNAEDRMNLNKIRQQVGIDTQGKLESIRQQMAARGLSGGGAELAAQLSSQQAGAAEESAMADRMTAQASTQALQAAMQTGQLSGQLRSQDFDVNKAKADAVDRFKLFDTQNTIASQQRNFAARNQGRMYNLGLDQHYADLNTQQENAERMRREQAKRTYWQDETQLAGMRSGAKLGQAQQYNAQAGEDAKMWQGMGAGVGAAAGAGLNYMSKRPAAKSTSSDVSDDTDFYNTMPEYDYKFGQRNK